MRKTFLALLLIANSCTKENNTPATGNITPEGIQVFAPPKNLYTHGSFFTSICVDNSNNKWLGCQDGLLKFDGTNWSYYNSNNTPVTLGYTSFTQSDNSGKIYAITMYDINNGKPDIVIFNGSNWSSYRLPFGVGKFYIDKTTNSLYFQTGTSGKIKKYNGSGNFSDENSYMDISLEYDFKYTDFHIFNNTIYAAFKNNATWINNANGGIVIKPLNSDATLHYYTSTTSNIGLNKLCTNDGNNIYVFGGIGSQTSLLQKLYMLNNSMWTTIPYNSPSQQLELISKLMFSKDGSLWICDLGNGFVKYKDATFTFYKVENNVPSISDIDIDKDNVKWFASQNMGLIEFAGQ